MSEQKSANNSTKKSMGPSMAKSLSIVGITTGYIFGPMLLFGGIGWWLSKRFDSIIFIVVALIIALIVSNILIFKRTETVVQNVSKQ